MGSNYKSKFEASKKTMRYAPLILVYVLSFSAEGDLRQTTVSKFRNKFDYNVIKFITMQLYEPKLT